MRVRCRVTAVGACAAAGDYDVRRAGGAEAAPVAVLGPPAHVLLPSWLLSRRHYAAEVIFAVRDLGAAADAGLDGVVVAVAVRRADRGAARGVHPAAAAGGAAGAASDPARRPAGALAVLQAVTEGLASRFGLDALAAHEVAAHLTAATLLAPVLHAPACRPG